MRDCKIESMQHFINVLAEHFTLQEHISHSDNTSLYIAFYFAEKSGPTKVAASDFKNTTLRQLLDDPSKSQQKSAINTVYICVERPEPVLYSEDTKASDSKASMPSFKPTTKQRKSQSARSNKHQETKSVIKAEPEDKVEPLDITVCLYNSFLVDCIRLC